MTPKEELGAKSNEMNSPLEIAKSFLWSRQFDALSPIDPKLLGGKGASLAEMTQLGLPVPPGFTLTTEAWQLFNQQGALPEKIWQETLEQLKILEKKTGQEFGNPDKPLIVSVRSGAVESMPAMMDTILNIGLNPDTILGLTQQTNEDCANNSYKRLQASFEEVTNQKLPQDPYRQLELSIKTILKSWGNQRAVIYRELYNISHENGTAVNIQKQVFGNADENSGSGVYFTRDPLTGKTKNTGNFIPNAQGEEVVGGRGKPDQIPKNILDRLKVYGEILEKYYKAPQDMEFTLEKGEEWLLQTRELKGTPLAKVVMTINMVKEGLITLRQAYQRISSSDINFLKQPGFDIQAEDKAREDSLIAKGEPISTGVAVGKLIDNLEDVKKGKSQILIHPYLDANNIKAFLPLNGLITTEGGTASHMALVLQALAKPGIILNNRQFIKPGEFISVNGYTGEVYKGKVPLAKKPRLSLEVKQFIEERRKALGESSWANALYPTTRKYSREAFLRKIEKIEPELKKWSSDKAQTIILLNQLVPEEYIIPATVLKADALEGIEEALEIVARQPGRQNIPRTCHNPERLTNAPWVIIPTGKDIKAFMHDSNFPGKYGGFVNWQEDSTLRGIIIASEPKGKIDPNLYSEHFAFTISCLPTLPPKIVIDVNLNTPHLRVFEALPPSQLIQIIASLDPESPDNLGEIKFKIGKDNSMEYAQDVTQIVAETVFNQWWKPPFSLPHVISALDEKYGLSVFEGQGRMKKNGKVSWIRIYGAKGREEEQKIKDFMKENK